jgi:phage baseplate assembly protein V
MIDELYGDLRSIITEGIVLAVDDTGSVQTVDVQTHDGTIRHGLEVHQAAGFATSPEIGGKALLLCVGGDIANMRALPLSDTTRFGAMQGGERCLYGPDGSRVHIRQGGIIEVLSASQVIIHSPTIEVTAPQGVTITANVKINGNLVVTGDITDQNGVHGTLGALRTAYDDHEHPIRDVQPGGATINTDTTTIPV